MENLQFRCNSLIFKDVWQITCTGGKVLSYTVASGFYAGSYSKSKTSSGSSAVRMGDVRWIVTVDWCKVLSWSAGEGEDRGWGKGRANNGHCSADVKCKWWFTTYDFDC
jgi:hypothetical protein